MLYTRYNWSSALYLKTSKEARQKRQTKVIKNTGKLNSWNWLNILKHRCSLPIVASGKLRGKATDLANRKIKSGRKHRLPTTSSVRAKADRQDGGLPGEAYGLVESWRFQTMEVGESWNKANSTSACFVRLSSSHLTTSCRRIIRCRMDGCKGIHHPLLHTEMKLGTLQAKVRRVPLRY